MGEPREFVKQRQALHKVEGVSYPCPRCPKVYETPGGLGGHMSWHARQDRSGEETMSSTTGAEASERGE